VEPPGVPALSREVTTAIPATGVTAITGPSDAGKTLG
jgi:KaiC/GvpD/RAD55 family RecA-like ATPase